MKKYKILFAILLCLVGRVSYAQDDFQFFIRATELSQNQFEFTIGYSGSVIAGCGNSSPTIVLEKGNLKLVKPSSNLSIDESISGVIKIQNFAPVGIGNDYISDLKLIMGFPIGTTCDGATQTVKATLCGKNAEVDVAVKSGSVQDRLDFSISQEPPSDTQDICFSNSLIKYHISVDNIINENNFGYSIFNGKVVVKISNRVDKLYLFKRNTLSPIAFNNDPLKGEISWNLPQEFSSTEGYDLYVTYPCSSPSSDIATHPTVKISGETRACQTALYTSDPVSVVNASGFTNQDCSTCEGSGNLLSLNIVKNFPCLTCPESLGSIKYQLNIGPNNADSTGVFMVRLPKELQTKLKGISRSKPGNIKWYDGKNWNDYGVFSTTDFSKVNVEKILWVVDMKNPVVDNTWLSFNDVVMNELPIYHSMRVGDTDNPFSPFLIEEAMELVSTEHCGKNVSLANYVNGADDQKDNTFKNINSKVDIIPGQKLTYRIVVNNTGYEDIDNISITNLLDPKILYNGNLKYGYTSSSTALSSELGMVPDNGIVENFPVNGNRAVIKRPVIGETGTITINSSSNNSLGLPFLCQSKKYLILQFDVIVSKMARLDSTLVNNTKLNYDSGSEEAFATVTVYSKLLPDAIFLAKCSKESNNDWVSSKDIIENRIPIKALERVQYKMVYENIGTRPVKLIDMVNTAPRPSDTFELTGISRESEMSIEYTGESQLLFTGVNQTIGFEVIYGTDLTIPQNGLNIFNTWDTNNVPLAKDATWMRIHFEPPVILNSGERLEFSYYGTVKGEVGQIGNNSFAYNTETEYGLQQGQTVSVVSVEASETQCAEPPACENCASFDLSPGETYLVSAWIKEENENNPYAQYKNYGNSQIRISFSSKEDKLLEEIGVKELRPMGNIIDGWQRIIGEFKVPEVADDFKLDLENNNTDERTTYFDDVRVIPSKGNMKSFVYDQKTQRLMAELDENNYGTYYEYDLEGGLIRIKKETEKGVFTIQETRSSNPKK